MTTIDRHSTPLQIVTAADDKYLHYLACQVKSLCDHGRVDVVMEITVINRGIPLSDKHKIESLVPHPHTLRWIEPKPDLLRTIRAPAAFADCSSHYFRLLAPFILPDHTRAIYLDADTLVVEDISPLWTLDLDGYAVAAVRDYLPNIHDAIDNWKDLGLDPEAPYFNSGVLVIDLRRWREEEIAEKVLSICDKHKDKLLAQGKWPQYDQYGLNVVLHGQWKTLDPMWNRGTDLPPSAARVVHFIGNGKVGLPTCQPIFNALFFEVLKQTPTGIGAHPSPVSSSRHSTFRSRALLLRGSSKGSEEK